MSLGRVTRSALWVYIGSVSSSILGYVFWMIASFYVSPEAVGSASAIIALQSLLMAIASFGFSTGIKRFVSRRDSDPNYEQASSYFASTLAMTLIINLPVVMILLLLSLLSIPAMGLTAFELGLVAILLFVSFWSPIIIALFDSLLETKTTAIAQIMATVVKLFTGTFFLIMDLDFVGILLAFIISSISIDLILLASLRRFTSQFSMKFIISTKKIKELVKGSLPAWIPNTLMIAGQALGVLALYSTMGGAVAGLYYIAYAIASIVYTLPTSILGLMFPILSAMEDGRKTAISNAIRLSLAITVPIGFVIALYPQIPFIFISSEYYLAYPLLSILVLGAVLYPIYAGYYGYVYAIGKYSHVLLLGISINASRIFLYILLISTMSSIGVALSYSFSIVIVLAVMIPSSKRIGFTLNWREYFKPIVITGIPAILLFIFPIHWIIGGPLIIVISLVAYTRLRVITKSEVHEISEAFLSEEAIGKLSLYFKPVFKILFGE